LDSQEVTNRVEHQPLKRRYPPIVRLDSQTDLVIAVDIAKRLGVSSQRVYVLAVQPGLPKPLGP